MNLLFALLCGLLLTAGPSYGEIRGMMPLSESLPGEPKTGNRLLLAKETVPFEDRFVDVILTLEPPLAAGEKITVSLHGPAGEKLAQSIGEPPASRSLFFSVELPQVMQNGGNVTMRITRSAGDENWKVEKPFTVSARTDRSPSGKIAVSLANPEKAQVRGMPFTFGVPFPNGLLWNEANVRLVDVQGKELPLQTKATSRWARFGSIRWLLCSFSADLSGSPQAVYLEYGPGIRRSAGPAMKVDLAKGVPILKTGALSLSPSGIAFLPGKEGGSKVPLLDSGSLFGGFVVDGAGREFTMDRSSYAIEELGPQKAVLVKSGWFVDGQGEKYCQFKTRFIFFKESPIIRIFHTWIFTGVAGEDKIRGMGWKFPYAAGVAPQGFLSGFDEPKFLKGKSLVQDDYDKSRVESGKGAVELGRAPGVMKAAAGSAALYFGCKDFWQNYPRELEQDSSSMSFDEWPRHGRKAAHQTDLSNMNRLWFAHEGEALDFKLPDAYFGDEFRSRWPKRGDTMVPREYSVAQGVSKTSEMWLMVSEDGGDEENAVKVLRGLDDETIQAVVDPAWIAGSKALYEIHERDVARYPEEERIYELHALAPGKWAERCEIYGKWIWGDVPWEPLLDERGFATYYRAFRKAHQGWPYSWIPYARSGDSRFRKLAEAATRKEIDVSFSHYRDERVPLPRGQWIRGYIPWASHKPPLLRFYTNKVNYLQHCYYLTGYERAKDLLDDLQAATKLDPDNSLFEKPVTVEIGRPASTMLGAYIETYQATFDPWYLAAAHRLADMQLKGDWVGTMWNPGLRDFLRFSGRSDCREAYLKYADFWVSPSSSDEWHYTRSYTGLEPATFAYHLTGNDFYLRRAAFWVDWARVATYEGEPDYQRGFRILPSASTSVGPMFTGYYLQLFPFALAAFEAAGRKPEPLAGLMTIYPSVVEKGPGDQFRYSMPVIALKKEADTELPICLRVRTTRGSSHRFSYRILDPQGRPFDEGDWDVSQEKNLVLPAGLAPGVYRVRVTGSSSFSGHRMYIPISPFGNREVLEYDAGETIAASELESRFWFQIPADVRAFRMKFVVPPPTPNRLNLVKTAVWDSKGEIVWKAEFDKAVPSGNSSLNPLLEVPQSEAGKLWRITIANANHGFSLDPSVPHIFAAARDRWFLPEPIRETVPAHLKEGSVEVSRDQRMDQEPVSK